MGILDKAKNAAQKKKGEAKEEAGRRADDPYLAQEGRKDQISGDLKNAGQHAKDAGRHLKDAVNH